MELFKPHTDDRLLVDRSDADIVLYESRVNDTHQFETIFNGFMPESM